MRAAFVRVKKAAALLLPDLSPAQVSRTLSTLRAFILIGCIFGWSPVGPATAQPANGVLAQLAPTGELRVALQVTNPVLVSMESAELRGFGPDISRALADRLRVPFRAVSYKTVPEMLADLPANAWDVALLTITPERARLVDYTQPYMVVENALVALEESDLTSIADIDRRHARIAVIDGSSNSLLLGRMLTSAQLVRVRAIDVVSKLLQEGAADAFADNRQLGVEVVARSSGLQLMSERYSVGQYAIALPKGRQRALHYLSEFVERQKRSGAIAFAISHAGIVGAGPAP